MTVLCDNVEDMLKRLETHSKAELTLVRALSEAIRQVDDQTLRELRNLSLQHELRCETILGELQLLAARMCQLPVKPNPSIRPATEQPPIAHRRAGAEDVLDMVNVNAAGSAASAQSLNTGGDWRQAAQNIEDDLDYAFGPPPQPRH